MYNNFKGGEYKFVDNSLGKPSNIKPIESRKFSEQENIFLEVKTSYMFLGQMGHKGLAKSPRDKG